MMRHAAKIESASLEDWMTVSVLDVCSHRPRLLESLRRNFRGTIPDMSDLAISAGRPSQESRDLCTTAMGLLWNEINAALGKGPVRGSDWKIILYTAAGARTIREAIQCWSFCSDASDGRCGRVRLQVRDGYAQVHWDELGSRLSFETALILLYSVGEFHSLLEWLIAEPMPLSQICLGHEESIFVDYGMPPLPVPIEMRANWTGFAFPEHFLDYPVAWRPESVMDRPGSNFLFSSDAGQMKVDFAERARRYAMRGLRDRHRMPRLSELAKESGASVATLRRRLEEQGSSYRQIKDSCRREIGLKLLRHTDLSIEEIANRLDYGDSDTFRRAFKIWMGTSPSRFRNELMARPTSPALSG